MAQPAHTPPCPTPTGVVGALCDAIHNANDLRIIRGGRRELLRYLPPRKRTTLNLPAKTCERSRNVIYSFSSII